MEASAPEQFPDALNRVEFGAVGREEAQLKDVSPPLPPGFMELCVMIAGIVCDDHHFAAGPTMACQHPEEVQACLGIEHAIGSGNHQFAVIDSHSTGAADGFSGRGMKANRIVLLGRHPHPAASSVLLKVDLVQSPQVEVIPAHQRPEFFLCLA
jgi:hypothetical protein